MDKSCFQLLGSVWLRLIEVGVVAEISFWRPTWLIFHSIALLYRIKEDMCGTLARSLFQLLSLVGGTETNSLMKSSVGYQDIFQCSSPAHQAPC